MWLRKVFTWLMPARIKRAYVLVGLYSLLTKQEEVNPEVLASLNQSLRLVNNPDSLLMPSRTPELLGIDLTAQIDLDNPNKLVEYVMDKIPRYWRYGIDKDFQHDLQSLMKYIRPGTYFPEAGTVHTLNHPSANWHRA